MRKSLIVGVFSCALIMLSGSENASAQTLNIGEINRQDIESVELILAYAKTDLAVRESSKTTTEDSGKELVEYIVERNDNLSKIAEKYKITWQRIYDKNTQLISPDIINEGDKLIIPADDEELESRELPVYEPAPSVKAVSKSRNYTVASAQPQVSQGSSAGNRYVSGYCTWYVKNRRPDLPNNLGNAATWVSRAAAQGIATGSTPRVGAVGQRANHVVYVESVNPDGTVTISEMNYRALYAKTTRTVPANYFTYIY